MPPTPLFWWGGTGCTPCHAEAVSIGSRVCHDRPRSPRANLQRRRCHGHAHWRHWRPIDGVHCVIVCPRQAWFVCVQTLPCSTVSKGRKSREGIEARGRQEGSNRRQRAVRPTKAAKAMAKGKIFQYVCPHCNQSVSSTIRRGQVDHRRTCGNSFGVREGRPFAKAYDYVCPTCNGHVASNVATGQTDHRQVCGNKFSVKDGVVKEKGLVYRCPFCKGSVRSDVRTGQINHRTVCGNQFCVKDGVVKEKGLFYRCPFCKGSVRSDVRTGQIDHRSGYGNRFYVMDGAVSKKTRCHAHSCPVCSTVVWSSQSCGRIAVTHDTPSGKRCQMKHWHVPDKKAKKKRR